MTNAPSRRQPPQRQNRASVRATPRRGISASAGEQDRETQGNAEGHKYARHVRLSRRRPRNRGIRRMNVAGALGCGVVERSCLAADAGELRRPNSLGAIALAAIRRPSRETGPRVGGDRSRGRRNATGRRMDSGLPHGVTSHVEGLDFLDRAITRRRRRRFDARILRGGSHAARARREARFHPTPTVE